MLIPITLPMGLEANNFVYKVGDSTSDPMKQVDREKY